MKKHKFKNVLLKKLSVSALSIAMVFSNMAGFYAGVEKQQVNAYAASTNQYELVDDVQDAAILHCWNWSYSTIEQHLELIAECGYSAIQTSPVTQPKDYEWEGVVDSDVGTPGIGGSGNWWKVYQPVTISVCDNGQTWFGTKDELESLCAKAEEYGIKVIVDIVANHMGNISGWQNSLSDVSPEVGEFWNPDMLTDESYWHINDLQVWMSDGREDITQGSMGMPDLNTGDSRVQQYFKDYLIELIDCGVDGFRFDAAKHIETPDDDSSYASNFWPNVLNPAESYYTQKTGGDLYVYGEILNTVGDNFNISSYTKYMSVTDNSAGNQCLDSFRNNGIGNISMHYSTDVSVLWAESHDTYMNESSRYGSDKSIVRTWSYVANKNGAAALYFVRPYYSKDILTNDVDGAFRSDLATSLEQAQMGECSTYTWASNEVAAINHFRNRMTGQSESYGTDGNIGYCKRGNGIILVNMDGAGSVSISSHGLSSGTYTDEVTGNTFTVSNGTLSGTIGSDTGVAVIYQNVMSNPSALRPAQITTSVANGSEYYTNGLEITLTAKNATSASYTASTGESGTFTGSKDITIGAGLSDGETVTLKVTATNSYGTVTKEYTFIKQTQGVEISTDKKDGSKFYTDGVDVTIEALYADSASYLASTGEKGTFTGSTTVNIGAGLADGETVTLTVTGTNTKGTVTKTFTYTRSENALGTTVLFKNTAGWTTVNAYAWNGSSDSNSSWPGVAMTVFDESQNIYMIEFDTANQYTNIIFNNGSAQTADLEVPDMGYIYDYSTGTWSKYELPVQPSISSTLASGEVEGATKVTFTVTDATSATYTV
ncbi:MAG: starch-binding protein, partial [Lachnospiraceae bacterium]|nr:starch-binding protein [Lachnospiraceae bacterium]